MHNLSKKSRVRKVILYLDHESLQGKEVFLSARTSRPISRSVETVLSSAGVLLSTSLSKAIQLTRLAQPFIQRISGQCFPIASPDFP